MNCENNLQHLLAGLPPEGDSGYFGLTMDSEDATLSLIPVEWDVTTSYADGTSRAPELIRRASHQLDLEHPVYGPVFLAGLASLPAIKHPNHSELREWAQQVIAAWERGEDALVSQAELLTRINLASAEISGQVYTTSQKLLNQGKIVGLIGGDHSCPLGLLRAVNEMEKAFTVLHIDAHHDLRDSYEGFAESHASIMFNALRQCHKLEKIVAVGIRDYAASERDFAREDPRVHTFYDHDLSEKKLRGVHFIEVVDEIVGQLSDAVYVSCDIDGLDPALCPSTGTPVPGGLVYGEFNLLLERLAESGKRIIGFDLCEVGSDNEWDANVGARVLYSLCGAALRSQNKLREQL